MFDRTPSALARYALALLVLALATVLRFVLIPVLDLSVPFILFFPAVVICAWFGGLGPGLLGTALSGAIAWYVFIPPQYSFKVSDRTAPAQLIIFLFAGTLISILAETLHRARRKTEESQMRERQQRERLRVTLASIGDAVIATDVEGRVTFMNQVAESLTGWKHDEAAGQPLTKVFVIVNEQTRMPVENPALRAIWEGVVSGLANHTVLIAKNGREYPIDDTGAPITDAQGVMLGAILVFRDITERRTAETERKRKEEELLESRERLRMAMEGGRMGIWTRELDESNRTQWSPELERIFGLNPGEFPETEEAFFDFVHPDDRATLADAVSVAIRDHTDYTIEFRYTRKGEISQRWMVGRGRAFYDSDGKPVRLAGLGWDITDRKQAELERSAVLASERVAREQAEIAGRAKDEFVAILSHELRAPLTAIILGTQLLRASARFDDPEMLHTFDTVERNAKLQAQLIEDLLDISRVMMGKLVLSARPVEIGQIIEMAMDSVRAAADAKSIQLRVHIDGRGSWISGDPNRLQQIAWNLLSNAVKFTPQHGSIEVRVYQDAAQAYVAVADSGCGISPEFLPYVFDRFSQANPTSGPRHAGLGLGLSIVKHLVELHGGTVRAESAGEGGGATFTVTFPLASVQEQPAALTPQLARDAGEKLEGLRVMVVDDAADTRELLTSMLTSYGAEVRACGSASEALETIAQWRPAVVVSDLAMPGEDGYSLIRKLRSLGSDRGGDTPAVALTGYATTEDRTRALAAGFQIHVPKPVEPAELVTVIASLAGRIHKRASLD
jgi:PAS domain S-box-containing protein